MQHQRDFPVALEAEQALLGALLMNDSVYSSVSALLEPKHFSEPVHQEIFDAIGALIQRGQKPNPVTVKLQMPSGDKMVGELTMARYLARLVAEAVSFSNAPHYAQAIKETYLRRWLISVGHELSEIAYADGDVSVLSDEAGKAQAAIADICNDLIGKADFYGSNILDDYLRFASKEKDQVDAPGVPIGIPEIGTVISEKRFSAKRLYGMLSSSGEGKTSLTMQLIYRAIADGHPTLLLSYDQTGPECVAQMIAQHVGLEVRRQGSGDMTDKEFDKAFSMAKAISQMPFQVIDCDSTKDTVARLSGYARAFVKRCIGLGKTPFIIIDHIGTIRPDAGDMKSDEGTKARNIGQQLKSMAKALNASVLVLQQRSGSGMKRLNPRPIKSDLFGGEVAVQPFDAIFYLYRAEAHMHKQIETAMDDKEADKIRARFRQQFGGEVEDMAEIGAIKVRFGKATIKRKVRFVAEFTKYISEVSEFDNQREFF